MNLSAKAPLLPLAFRVVSRESGHAVTRSLRSIARLPDQHEPLRVGLAKVRWAKQQRFGVEFMAFSDGDQVRLGQLLHRHVDRL